MQRCSSSKINCTDGSLADYRWSGVMNMSDDSAEMTPEEAMNDLMSQEPFCTLASVRAMLDDDQQQESLDRIIKTVVGKRVLEAQAALADINEQLELCQSQLSKSGPRLASFRRQFDENGQIPDDDFNELQRDMASINKQMRELAIRQEQLLKVITAGQALEE
jgi:hypothetical protein